MKKLLMITLASCFFADIAVAQTPHNSEGLAKQIGIIIAEQNYSIPQFAQKMQKEGSGAVIAERCGKEFPNANLKQVCMDSAQDEDARIFMKMLKAQRGG